MQFFKRWRLFREEPKFHSLRNQSFDGDEGDIESEKLLPKAGLARHLARSNLKPWIYLTIANLIVLSMNIFLAVVTLGAIFSNQKNADLRPVSWWCTYYSI